MQSLKSLEAKLKSARKDRAYHEAQIQVCAQAIRKLEAEIKAVQKTKLPLKGEVRSLPAEERLALAKRLLRSQDIGYFCDHRPKTDRWSLKPCNRPLTPKIMKALTLLSDGVLLRQASNSRGPHRRFYSSVWTEGKPYRWYFQK